MNDIVKELLKKYTLTTTAQYENALKEIMQEIALLGLYRSKFFEHAAFYGGTCCRLLYGLDRFSEDLDFTLLTPTPDFDFTPYQNAVKEELTTYGFKVEITKKSKSVNSTIISAFMKANTAQFDVDIQFDKGRQLTIKFDIDTTPPENQTTNAVLITSPIDYYVKTLAIEQLFAGKMHTILNRKYKTNVKGRDWYDLIWYINKTIPLDLNQLEKRLKNSDDLDVNVSLPLTHEKLMMLLIKKINETDFEIAKIDIRRFIKDTSRIENWNRQYFLDLIQRLKVNTITP